MLAASPQIPFRIRRTAMKKPSGLPWHRPSDLWTSQRKVAAWAAFSDSEQTGLLEPRRAALDDGRLIRQHRHELRVVGRCHQRVRGERLRERGARLCVSAKMT